MDSHDAIESYQQDLSLTWSVVCKPPFPKGMTLVVACTEYAVAASRSAEPEDDFAERASHQDLGGFGALQN